MGVRAAVLTAVVLAVCASCGGKPRDDLEHTLGCGVVSKRLVIEAVGHQTNSVDYNAEGMTTGVSCRMDRYDGSGFPSLLVAGFEPTGSRQTREEFYEKQLQKDRRLPRHCPAGSTGSYPTEDAGVILDQDVNGDGEAWPTVSVSADWNGLLLGVTLTSRSGSTADRIRVSCQLAQSFADHLRHDGHGRQ